jgi:hypothetical protein
MSIDNATPEEWNKAGRYYFRDEDGEHFIPESMIDPINLYNVDQAFDKAMQVDVATLSDYIKTKQIGGNHYKTNIEPWQVFLDWGLDPWACNVIKYVQRHRKKAGKEDLEKAKHYLEYMIENYEEIGNKYYAKG